MRIAVTGGAGFFGRHVVEKLIQDGHRLFIIDDLSRGNFENLEGINKTKFSFTLSDFSDPKKAFEWTEVLRKERVEILIHMASPMSHNPLDHVSGLELAANYLRSLRALNIPSVYISSSSANTDPATRGYHGQTFRPEGLYGITKMFIEWALFDLKEKGVIPNYVALRPSNIYGPYEVFSGHSHIHVIPNLIRKVLLGEKVIEVLGDGSETRPFTFVTDAAEAVVNAVKLVSKGKTVESALIHGKQISIKEVVKLILKNANAKTKIVWKKGKNIGVASRILPHHDGKLIGNWKPKVSINEGLAKTIDWVKVNQHRLTLENFDNRPLGSTLA